MKKFSLLHALAVLAAFAASNTWAAPVAFWQFDEKTPGTEADATPGAFS